MTPLFTERSLRPRLGSLTCVFLLASALPAVADDTRADPAERAATAERAPVCETQVKLGATFILHERPDQSLALLRTPKAQVAGIYRRGMYVEDFQVIAVEPRGVLLAQGDRYCWLRLKPDPSRPQPQPPPPPPRRPKSKR